MCLLMFEPFVKDDVETEDEVYFAFFLFSGHFFFFCCELVGVIDPVASVTRLSLSNVLCFFGPLSGQRVSFGHL